MAAAPHPGQAFGIDIGGTGIKGAVVDIATGQLVDRAQADPHAASGHAGGGRRRSSASSWPRRDGTGSVGATFPAVIKHGVAQSAANVDHAWIGTDVDKCFTDAVGAGNDVIVLNDADAAGIAEARFGAAKGVKGVVILLTFGTGIGSALLIERRPGAEHRTRPSGTRRSRRREARRGLGP